MPTATSARADGCFVFHWDKKTDITEPTQKAIIFHDAGHEEMLLQVRYEGPLSEFGWLMPVPTAPQTRQALSYIRGIVEAGGLTMDHVVYSQVYLADVSQVEGLDKVWREVFPSNAPARAVLGVKRMPTETPVEINAVAVLDLKRRFSCRRTS